MVLLHVLHRLAPAHRWKLSVAHFNHQLRAAASDADERLTLKTARKLKLPVIAGRGDVQAFADQHGLSVEMAARKLRHDFLAAVAVENKISAIALAHHAGDQVELFFLRLLRGSGGGALAGMKWSNPSPSNPDIRLIRPLLDLPKADLLRFAADNKIEFSEDASNASLDIRRNRIRHELIPSLVRHYQPALNRTILRLMDLIGAEAEFVTQAADDWLAQGKRKKFNLLPLAMQRQIVHQQLAGKKLAADFEMIERLRLNPAQWIAVNAGHSVCRDANGMIQVRPVESFTFNSRRRKLLLARKTSHVSFAGVKIRCRIADNRGAAEARPGEMIEHFDADKVGAPVYLRRWQPGDRFQPIGTNSAKKLQDLFTDLKVPRAERHQRVVAVTSQGGLFWVEGLRMAEKFKMGKNTVRTLHWSWRRESPGLSPVADCAAG